MTSYVFREQTFKSNDVHVSSVMLHCLYATSSLLNFWPTNFPTYACCLFLYYLRVRLGSYNFWAERRGYYKLGGRALRPQVHLAAVKPRASRSDV